MESHFLDRGMDQVSADCFNDVSVLDTMEPCPEQCGGHGTCVDERYCQCTAWEAQVMLQCYCRWSEAWCDRSYLILVDLSLQYQGFFILACFVNVYIRYFYQPWYLCQCNDIIRDIDHYKLYYIKQKSLLSNQKHRPFHKKPRPGFTGHDCLQPLTCRLDCIRGFLILTRLFGQPPNQQLAVCHRPQ